MGTREKKEKKAAQASVNSLQTLWNNFIYISICALPHTFWKKIQAMCPNVIQTCINSNTLSFRLSLDISLIVKVESKYKLCFPN